MSANDQLREAFADDETRQWAAEADNADPNCPACGKAGVPTSSNYHWNWFECVSPDCRTAMFDIESANDSKAGDSSGGGRDEM